MKMTMTAGWMPSANDTRWSAMGSIAGVKRRADESNLSLTDSERFLAKRLHLLSIGPSEFDAQSIYHRGPASQVTPAQVAHREPSLESVPRPTTTTTTTTTTYNRIHEAEVMQVDSTRDRVYIHDLDEELAEPESDEARLIFLPDIEKMLSRIPSEVLQRRPDGEPENQELVLYDVPKSLTLDEGHDSVRKAILEARQRAREKAAEDARHQAMNRMYDHAHHAAATETAHGYHASYLLDDAADPDAMDIG